MAFLTFLAPPAFSIETFRIKSSFEVYDSGPRAEVKTFFRVAAVAASPTLIVVVTETNSSHR
jgi:hypothetical protein